MGSEKEGMTIVWMNQKKKTLFGDREKVWVSSKKEGVLVDGARARLRQVIRVGNKQC